MTTSVTYHGSRYLSTMFNDIVPIAYGVVASIVTLVSK